MKKYIKQLSIVIGIFGIAISNAQSTSKNYISTKVYQKAVDTSQIPTTTNDDQIQTITYFDGLGRPIQENSVRAGGDQGDIVTYHQYDSFGREASMYLPFGLPNNNGDYEPNADTYAQEYHFDTHTDIGDRDRFITFQNSPLGEIKKERLPMDRSLRTSNSQGEIAYEIGFNTLNDSIQSYVVDYEDEYDIIEYGSFLRKHTSYFISDKKLYKKTTKDENWHPNKGNDHTIEEYTNPRGQLILKRTFDKGKKHDTYYVYGSQNNLCYVVPPLASEKETLTEDDIDALCYQYLYDTKQRIRQKKVPGKGWEYMVYDKLDRPILTQDAILRKGNQWLFTKYDVFDRIVYTGIYTHDEAVNQVTMQEEVDSYTALHESFDVASSWSVAGTRIQYTNTVFPSSNIEVLIINYYDHYDMAQNLVLASLSFPLVQGEITTGSVKGLATMTKVKVLGQNHWTETKTLYDAKGQVIAIISGNSYLKTVDVVEHRLNFTGKPTKTRTFHRKDTMNAIVTIDDFTYDHVGRLSRHTQRIGDTNLPIESIEVNINVSEPPANNTTLIASNRITISPNTTITANSSNTFRAYISPGDEVSELIASNTYNGLGQLEQKKVGNQEDQPLQTIDYRYNIQGGLSGINNHSIREEDNFRDISTVTLDAGDLFGMQINYSHPTANATPLYNGNISEIHWKTASEDALQKTYIYEYDALNRITKAEDNTNRYNLNSIAYDQNGNILSLNRSGHINDDATNFGVMDNLRYNYNGNQLLDVTDSSGYIYGFKDGNTSGDDYAYDENGNMIMDKNKGISRLNDITYNHLNLPKKVTVNYANNIEYIYDASGTKLEKKVGPYGNTTHYAGNYIYETIGGAGTFLKFIQHAEGYIEPKNSSNLNDGFDYVYQYKDHLGNIRLSYSDKDNDGHIDIVRNEIDIDGDGDSSLEILEEKNYYTFGLQHKGYNNAISGREHPYSYNGKEEQNELGLDWLDYGARNYDPALSRWMNIDPLADKFPNISPYAAMNNNPLYWIDPDGRENIPALLWALKNMANKGIPSNYSDPYFAGSDNRWTYNIGTVPDRTVCYESCFMAYMNSGNDVLPTLRTGFTNKRNAFKGRSTETGGMNWFKEGDGTDRQFVTDISKGELGDIVFMGEVGDMQGHAVLLASEVTMGTTEINGKEVQTMFFYALTTSSDTDSGNYGGELITWTKNEDGKWIGSHNSYEFRGYGQMTNVKATDEQKQKVTKLVEEVKNGN